MIERLARAKINLSLHVTGQQADGYHLIDSLVVFAEFGDRILVEKPHHPHGPLAVSIGGPFADGLGAGPENLVSSAAMMLRQALITTSGEPAPVLIHLEKNLPVASGIGGGSADAAATLIALSELWGYDGDLFPIAKALGADVPMCLSSRTLRACGIGDQIEEMPSISGMPLVLVNPGVEISTPEVFRRLSSKDNQPMDLTNLDDPVSTDTIASLRNDLQPVAIELAPQISNALGELRDTGALVCRMSGSGATCFGIFGTMEDAEAAHQAIASKRPDWWCVATTTLAT